MVDGLFDSRDIEPRVRFGGLEVGCVLDEAEEDEEEERLFSSGNKTEPLAAVDVIAGAALLLLLLLIGTSRPVAFVPFGVWDVLLLDFSCAAAGPEVAAVADDVLLLVGGSSPGFFLCCCSNELNSASGSANSLGSLGKGRGSISSRAAKLYMVLRCVQMASVPMSRFSALDSRSDMQAMKKYLFIPTGFRPSSAKNNWISLSGLHSSSLPPVADDVDDMVILCTHSHSLATGRRQLGQILV